MHQYSDSTSFIDTDEKSDVSDSTSVSIRSKSISEPNNSNQLHTEDEKYSERPMQDE
jgi:hypothetical protein